MEQQQGYTVDQKNTIYRNMIKYGGGFASSLGEAYIKADEGNSRRLEKAFPELMEKYLKFEK